MKVALRVDASHRIGTGHLLRCLTVADRLVKANARCLFICRTIPHSLESLVREHGHEFRRLPPKQASRRAQPDALAYAAWLDADWKEDADATREVVRASGGVDWLITDHYAIDRRWHAIQRPHVSHIMAIDDLADRAHDCDLLLDQNELSGTDDRYRTLVPARCTLLLGPRYALLRPEFAEWRRKLPTVPRAAHRFLICFGGSDPGNHTAMAIAALDQLTFKFSADVVVGSAHAGKEAIAGLCRSRPGLTFHCQTERMAELMANATLAIGAGGSMAWERLCLGLPSIIVAIEGNQVAAAENLARLDLACYVGLGARVSAELMAEAIRKLISNAAHLGDMRQRALVTVDGLGTERVVASLLKAMHASRTKT